MENDKILSPAESLKLIAETIEKTKSNVQNGSFYFLLWGWLVSISGIAQFIMIKYTDIKTHYYVWPIMAIIGTVACIIYGFKVERQKKYETYLDSVFMNLWTVLGVSFFFIVFMVVWLHNTVVPFVLLLAGIGTLASGLIIKFKPMIFGGVLFFIFSIIALFVPQPFDTLVSSLAIVTGYLIPGYILKYTQPKKA
ncbi:MAG: hypothetical protein KKG99_03255 [Bacteroidetes bacterium]|nr:hypothetical protein [Bacteroidota bacterium]